MSHAWRDLVLFGQGDFAALLVFTVIFHVNRHNSFPGRNALDDIANTRNLVHFLVDENSVQGHRIPLDTAGALGHLIIAKRFDDGT